MNMNNLTLFFRIFWHTKTALQKLCPIFGVQFIRRFNSVSFVSYFVCFHTIRGTYCMMLSHYLRRTKNNAIAPITGAMARVINAD